MNTKNLFIVTLLLVSNFIWAHSALDDSIPKHGEILDKNPKQIVLIYTQPVKLVKFELISSEHKPVDTDFKATLDDREEFVIEVCDLKNDLYTVLWTIMGADGHKSEGDFQFTIQQNTQQHQPKKTTQKKHTD